MGVFLPNTMKYKPHIYSKCQHHYYKKYLITCIYLKFLDFIQEEKWLLKFLNVKLINKVNNKRPRELYIVCNVLFNSEFFDPPLNNYRKKQVIMKCMQQSYSYINIVIQFDQVNLYHHEEFPLQFPITKLYIYFISQT